MGFGELGPSYVGSQAVYGEVSEARSRGLARFRVKGFRMQTLFGLRCNEHWLWRLLHGWKGGYGGDAEPCVRVVSRT